MVVLSELRATRRHWCEDDVKQCDICEGDGEILTDKDNMTFPCPGCEGYQVVFKYESTL